MTFRKIFNVPIRPLFKSATNTIGCRFVLASFDNKKEMLNDQRIIAFITRQLKQTEYNEFLNDVDDFASRSFPIHFTRNKLYATRLEQYSSNSYAVSNKQQEHSIRQLCVKYAGIDVPSVYILFQKGWHMPREVFTTKVIIQRDTGNHEVDIFNDKNILYSNVPALCRNIRNQIINV
jgi:hypothetical protein